MPDKADNPLPWSERVGAISIHPDMASRDDIARMAAELMETTQHNTRMRVLLERMEWGCEDGCCDLGPMCFFCRGYEEDGHKETCPLKRVLEVGQ